jgi:hypothetical protein
VRTTRLYKFHRTLESDEITVYMAPSVLTQIFDFALNSSVKDDTDKMSVEHRSGFILPATQLFIGNKIEPAEMPAHYSTRAESAEFLILPRFSRTSLGLMDRWKVTLLSISAFVQILY